MAKVQSANDECFGAASNAKKSAKVTKEVFDALVEKANKKNRFMKNEVVPFKKIIFRKIDGVRVPFILKDGDYVPMKIVDKK